MTNQHPITPPPKLVEKWAIEYWGHPKRLVSENEKHIATQAARWGADQELEACEQAIIDRKWFADPEFRLAELHNARRPKPPSLKELALNALSLVMSQQKGMFDGKPFDTIRRALEALPEMTKQINGDKLFVIDPHPAIPPSDQLKKWEDKWFDEEEHADVLLIQAFQAGADQELEACLADIQTMYGRDKADWLRSMRRPKPPSLKKQALEALETLNQAWIMPKELDAVIAIRRALEALPE